MRRFTWCWTFWVNNWNHFWLWIRFSHQSPFIYLNTFWAWLNFYRPTVACIFLPISDQWVIVSLTWYRVAQQGPLKQKEDDLRRHMQLTMHGLTKDSFCLPAGSPGLVTVGDPSPGLDPECQRFPSGFFLSSLLPRLILTTCLLSSILGNFTVFCSDKIFYLFLPW